MIIKKSFRLVFKKIGPFLWWLSPFHISFQNLSIIIAIVVTFLRRPNELSRKTLEVRKSRRVENIHK